MASIVKILRVVADPNRLRILLLLAAEELSVAELQEILVMGQSTISTHLSQLKNAGLVEDRRTGKSNLYRLGEASHSVSRTLKGHDFSRAISARKENGASAPEETAGHGFMVDLLERARTEIPEAGSDQATMRRVLRKRQDKTRTFFDSVAGRLGKDYVPGKSWKSLAEALLYLMPPLVVADLGTGEGSSALLLARGASKVIAVDSSARMLEVGREHAQRAGMSNIEFRMGDMEELPIGNAEVDLVFFSQSLHHAAHPERALREAARILRPEGRVVVLDLSKHRFEEARELYADEWLGFSEAEMEELLANAGFAKAHASIVDKEPEGPQFQTLLAVAYKAT
ncbi:MAG TPA: metalloregulator ArsR/SmtB family transcription factor [Terracidiphilus sp.]|nr:metalloregulator ArsR/SmtB family transcription factor [Terracidiphilus sp.]